MIGAILADHASILSDLKKLSLEASPNAKLAKRLFVNLGAHHLAEEATLYQFLARTHLPVIGRAQVFHEVLDVLADGILIIGDTDGMMCHRLSLLEYLLRVHFADEEAMLLGSRHAVGIAKHQQWLGEQYQLQLMQARRVLA